MEQLPLIIYRGLLIGILVSAPMGPIGMLVIQRTLNKGRWPAFFTGLGAALSDLFYSLLTGLSLSFVTDFITDNHILLQIIGSVVFIAYGIYLFNSNPTRTLKTQLIPANSWWKDFGTGFLLTFSNPLIVFFIITLFARFNYLIPEFEAYHYVAGYMCIFAGAILWWFLVTFSINKVRNHFNVRSLWIINRVLAVIMFLIAAYGIFSGVMEHINSLNP